MKEIELFITTIPEELLIIGRLTDDGVFSLIAKNDDNDCVKSHTFNSYRDYASWIRPLVERIKDRDVQLYHMCYHILTLLEIDASFMVIA